MSHDQIRAIPEEMRKMKNLKKYLCTRETDIFRLKGTTEQNTR